MDIEEALVWAYNRQKVLDARAVSEAEIRATGGVDSIVRVGQLAALGTSIDRSPGAGLFECHPDADALHQMVQLLPLMTANILMDHALLRCRPDWKPRGVRMRAVMEQYGSGWRPRTITKNKMVVGHDVRPDPHPNIVRMYRDIYRLWFDGLTNLVSLFDDYRREFTSLTVQAPAAHAEPWTDPSEVTKALSGPPQAV
jgi:hypothetical protein